MVSWTNFMPIYFDSKVEFVSNFVSIQKNTSLDHAVRGQFALKQRFVKDEFSMSTGQRKFSKDHQFLPPNVYCFVKLCTIKWKHYMNMIHKCKNFILILLQLILLNVWPKLMTVIRVVSQMLSGKSDEAGKCSVFVTILENQIRFGIQSWNVIIIKGYAPLQSMLTLLRIAKSIIAHFQSHVYFTNWYFIWVQVSIWHKTKLELNQTPSKMKCNQTS